MRRHFLLFYSIGVFAVALVVSCSIFLLALRGRIKDRRMDVVQAVLAQKWVSGPDIILIFRDGLDEAWLARAKKEGIEIDLEQLMEIVRVINYRIKVKDPTLLPSQWNESEEPLPDFAEVVICLAQGRDVSALEMNQVVGSGSPSTAELAATLKVTEEEILLFLNEENLLFLFSPIEDLDPDWEVFPKPSFLTDLPFSGRFYFGLCRCLVSGVVLR